MVYENNSFIIYLKEISSLKLKLLFNKLFLKQINFVFMKWMIVTILISLS
jgi:hypothetical protein